MSRRFDACWSRGLYLSVTKSCLTTFINILDNTYLVGSCHSSHSSSSTLLGPLCGTWLLTGAFSERQRKCYTTTSNPRHLTSGVDGTCHSSTLLGPLCGHWVYCFRLFETKTAHTSPLVHLCGTWLLPGASSARRKRKRTCYNPGRTRDTCLTSGVIIVNAA